MMRGAPSPGVRTTSSVPCARRDALDGHATLQARTQDERPPRAKHGDRDHGVVEPSHVTIAVQTLKVVTVPIEDHHDTRERDVKAGPKMEVGLAQHVVGVGADADPEPVLRNVVVVAEDFGLRPRERFVALGEDAAGPRRGRSRGRARPTRSAAARCAQPARDDRSAAPPRAASRLQSRLLLPQPIDLRADQDD